METYDLKPLSRDSEADFLPYEGTCCFGDTTFRSLYAWQPIFGYRYAQGTDYLLLSEQKSADEQMYILFRRPESDLSGILREVLPYVGNCLHLEFVSESELPAFRAAADSLGLSCGVSCDDQYSDYIYEKEYYCSLSGTPRKSLRGDVNALLKQCPDIRMELYRPEYASMCMEVFTQWCEGRNCDDCFYGCERDVMARFLEVYREPGCFGAIAFSGEQPLSFLMGEMLPGGVLDIHFQKNAVRQRGLTYWLSRELVLQQPTCRWINLEEDMGIPGIRMDKQRLHPYEMRKKYTVVLQPRE